MNTEKLKQLVEPFHPADVQWKAVAFPRGRRDRALVAPYYDVRLVYQRLDDVLGPFGWQIRHQSLPSGGIYTEIGIWDSAAGWIWKGDVGMAEREKRKRGAGTEDDPEEDVVLDATKAKGDATDGAKRAAAVWGIGRVYWLVPKDWVDWNDATREPMTPPALPDYALPYDMQKHTATATATASGQQIATRPEPVQALASAATTSPGEAPADQVAPDEVNPARPYKPEEVRRRLDNVYTAYKADPNIKVAGKATRGVLAGLMETAFPKDIAVAARKDVLMYFFAKDSTKDLSDAHIAALLKYLDTRIVSGRSVIGPYVAVELRQIRAARVSDG